MSDIVFTPKLRRYMFNLAFRLVVVIAMFWLYVLHRDWFMELLTLPTFHHLTFLHVVWAVFMVIMLMHLFPSESRSMALLKSKEVNFVPVENYSEFELLKFVQAQNRAAWRVMMVWLFFNAVWALLYLTGVIQEAELLLLTVFYFLCDYICILFFCPFQSKIMKNKCCVNCRIYDWGHFMMFTPMLFIKNFFSWSLFFTSLVVLIRWELVYAKYPERFWEGSNRTLQCAHCSDRTCQFKEKLRAPGRNGGD